MWGRKTKDLLEQILAQNAEMNKAILETVNQISKVSAAQSEVLSKYLDLFKTPEKPRSWKRDPQMETANFLAEQGFPVDGTEEEQATWLMDHLDG